MKTKFNFLMVITLLFGLVITSPVQTVAAAIATDTASFVFTSSANPSEYGMPVTFTLSATGSDEVFRPSGSVDFYADGVSICSDVPINNPNNTIGTPEIPATCTVSTLSTGVHVITADFSSNYLAMYVSETLYLDGGQTVGAPPTVTISPVTLASQVNGTYVVQQLIPDWAGYLTYKIIDGSLPPGINLYTFYFDNIKKYIGELSGLLAATDTFTYTFTVGAYDVNQVLLGSRQYTWNILTPFMTISPATLPNAEYQKQYSQQLSVAGGYGYAPYRFYLLSGPLPSGITLSESGLLSGFPDNTLPGQYPLYIKALDAKDNPAYHNYTLVLDKGVPEVTVNAATEIYWNYPFYLSAVVEKHTSLTSSVALDGTVAFYIDDEVVPGCEAVPYLNTYYSCLVDPNNLNEGSHTVRAEYTPTGWYAGYYTSGSASKDFIVQTTSFVVQGSLYDDENRNAIKDPLENQLPAYGWTINLDENCDGVVDSSTITSYGGFSFSEVPSGGQCYRLTVVAEPGYQQTTILEDFVLTESIFVSIGFYYPTITISPSENALPSGSVGEEYNQVFSASGGTGPYTFTAIEDDFSSLPEGLTLSADGVLSGTPTMTGYYNLAIQAEDANHATGFRYYILDIKTDGVFILTSSSNPSTPGEAVTFTVSASDDESSYPIGLVTFLSDGTPIDGCSGLFLNILFDENGNFLGYGDYPATCTIAGLEVGSHEITATYADWTGVYNEPTLALTQVVASEVTNTAPVANPGGPYLAAINTAITFDGSSSSDADSDPLTFTWSFGDDSSGSGAIPSHTYATAGIYDVCLTVNDGSVNSDPACTLAVVYDPSAGFVTGGGWIDSPAGAYLVDPSLSGKATFGFVSKYKKGATVPDGNTEFQFEAGGFKFQSSAYEWLVVSKDKATAQFKGSGMVNGTLDPNGKAYKFMLWAGDGSPDTFRIRIWWEDAAGEHDVYDNGFEQAIGAGSIVVHTGK